MKAICFAVIGASCMLSMACGSSEPDGPNGASPPSEAKLCQLVLGKTTVAQAESVLGQPIGQTGAVTDDISIVMYEYGTPSQPAALLLTFQTHVFDSASLQGMNYPSCWAKPDGGK